MIHTPLRSCLLYNMSPSSEVLPYSVSSGLVYSAFEKLQGSKNYATWKNCMHTMLITLSQWEVVTGAIVAPTPVASNKMTTEEVKENKAWIVCKTSAFMEISFCIADSALSILDDIDNPKLAWETLARHFGAKQEGLQSALIAKLQMASWDGDGTIQTHQDYMVDLHIQLTDTSKPITNKSFFSYFIESLPCSLDLFISLYDNSTHDVDLLCSKFAKYEM